MPFYRGLLRRKKKKKLNKVHDKRKKKIQRVMGHLADWGVAKKVGSVCWGLSFFFYA